MPRKTQLSIALLMALLIQCSPPSGPPKVTEENKQIVRRFIQVVNNQDFDLLDLLVVSFEGVNLLERGKDGQWQRTLIGEGDQKSSPSRGASEIKHGRLGSGGDYIATIEPWHGNKVVVYTRPDGPRPRTGAWMWTRHVL